MNEQKQKHKQETIRASNITTLISVIVNTALCLIKTGIGAIAGSTALVADGIHSLADLISDFFAFFIIRISHAEPDEDHPYGHGKFETFGTMALALTLAVTALGIAFDATQTLLNPELQKPIAYWALVAAFVSILANEGLYQVCKYYGEKVNSPIIIANAWHHRSDSITSIAALIGIGLNMAGILIADAIAALVVTLFLLKISYKIGKKSFNELVDSAVSEKKIKEINDCILACNGVLDLHQLRTRSIGGKIFIDVHVDVPANISVSEGHAIAHGVEERLFKDVPHTSDVTIHIDPYQAKQEALPDELCRENLEPILDKILKAHNKDAYIDHIYVHILNHGAYADIRIQGGNIKDMEKLEQELISDNTPLTGVTISIRHI